MKQQKVTLKFFKQRGQMLVLYTLMIPVILLFVGLALDLGWYYLNVSRMQNAADAAALAGASAIIDSNSTKLKDLAPVLIELPEDNGLTDDGEPKVETSTSTETTTDTTETDAGTTIITTKTTTTTTKTTSKTKLEEISTTAGNEAAKDYTVKNIGKTQNIQADEQETVNVVIDNWSLFDSPGDRRVDTNLNLVKRNGEFYYIVTLTENIRHFFLSGLFDGMEAKVVAIAQLVPKDQVVVDTRIDVITDKEFVAKLEDAKNKNVIVGNWEVQNYYRNITANDGTITLVDAKGNAILDANGNTQTVRATRDKEYSEVFTSAYDKSVGITREVYTSSWNKFQDHYVHFQSGTPIRYEIIDVFDDVVLVDPNLTGKDRYADSNMQSYGKTDNGYVKNPTANGSSIKRNSASGNTLDSSSYTYNKDGSPYAWQDLDSIDVDFQPEVSWTRDKSVYPLQDWDLKFGYDGEMSGTKYGQTTHEKGSGNSNVGVGAVQHYAYNQDGSEKTNKKLGGWHDHLRIHSTINFKTPYHVRSTYEKSGPNDTDVLWVRIESEPMFRYPDSKDPKKQTKNHLDIGGLNSVRQIIINFTESNVGDDYRPIVIFYDGPERYSTNNSIRDSQPLIVNLAVPTRAIIYAPNSPVVVIGNHKDDFKGFIVAKKYLRLKETKDFEDEISKYERANDKGEIAKNDKNLQNYPNYRAKETVDNPYWGTKHTKADGTIVNYRDNGEPKTINWLYKKITNNPTDANGNVVGAFDMYVDDYGNVQYMELDKQPTNIGKYDTFGKTNFTTHNYELEKESASNMLLSGVKFNYETNKSNDGDIRYKGTRVF